MDGEQIVGLALLSSSVFGQICNAAANQQMLFSGLGWYCKKEKQGKRIMASVAARTGVWEWGTSVFQEKKKKKIGGERGIILSLSEGTVNRGERRKKREL